MQWSIWFVILDWTRNLWNRSLFVLRGPKLKVLRVVWVSTDALVQDKWIFVWINSILATLTVTWQQESSYWLNFTTNCFVVVVLTFIYCISHLSGWWVENHVSSGDVKTLVLLSCQSVSSVYGHQSYWDTTSFFFSVMTHL